MSYHQRNDILMVTQQFPRCPDCITKSQDCNIHTKLGAGCMKSFYFDVKKINHNENDI